LEEEGRAWFKKLEEAEKGDDPENLWWDFKSVSTCEFLNIYKRLGLEFSYFDGEANHSQNALDVVKKCQELGIATESQGAIVVEMEGKKPPCILQKGDGATTYLARDVGAVIYRHEQKHFDAKMLYVVGQAQAFHFEQVFHVLKKMGYEWADKCQHIPFGLLKFQGSKFSSRQGNMLLLKDVLDTAAEEVKAIVNEKGSNISDDSIDKIGMGAVVFADLSRKRILNANFNWEDILNFDGNTGPYLQYTLTRCYSIINKATLDLGKQDTTKNLELISTEEAKRLLLKLGSFPEVILEATHQCEPSVLSQYIIKVAKLTNKYIHGVWVIQDDKQLQKARMALIKCAIIVLEEALRILGISSLKEM
jgi:arginyl-tRNA synthetase